MAKKRPKLRAKQIVAIFFWIAVIIAAVVLTLLSRSGKLDIGLNSGKFAKIYSEVPPEGELQIHVIDVGQADSTLIRTAHGNILIDAGTNDSETDLKAHLYACKIQKIDYLILTHPHSDHIGGADMIIESFDVGTVLTTDTPSEEETYNQLVEALDSEGTNTAYPGVGDSYTMGDVTITALSPVSESDDLNSMSLVVKLTFGDISMLFTGDSQEESEIGMLEHHGPEMLDCDYLKVAHHGSASSSCETFLSAVTPEIASISCGKGNSYGHPRSEVLERLDKSGCKTVVRTDISGTQIIVTDGNSIWAATD